MNISFENPDKVNGLLTIVVEEADFKENVDKTLKDYRKKANFPGFRPGMVPMGLIKKQFGTQVKMEAVNKFVGEQIYKYVKDNDIAMLGEPLPSEKQVPVDIEKDAPYTFVFDIAVAPEFKIELNGKNKIDYYKIKADDELVNKQIEMLQNRAGEYVQAEELDAEQNDMLKGDLRELDAEGNTKEGGITVEAAVLMPQYIKVEEQKNLFNGAKLGDIVTFNPRKAYPEGEAELSALLKISKEEAKDLTADFSFQITEIKRYKKAELGQDFYEKVFGKDGGVTNEEELRAKIVESLAPQLQTNSDFKFLEDVKKYTEEKVGELQFPEALLKRIMLLNNRERGEEFVEKNFAASIDQLKWHLIREQLVKSHDIKVDDADIKAAAKEGARMQCAQCGMDNVPEEYLDNYVDEMLKKRENIDAFLDRAVDRKLTNALKASVKLNEKEVTLEEFNKLMGENA